MKQRRGFTLIEVLVAVAILGIGLTAIFSSQWVSFASIKHARHLNEATSLARCKMSESEWDVEQNGFQATDVNETGPCCEGFTDTEMTCSWTVAKVEFPQANFGDLDLESELDFGSGPSLLGGGISGPGAGAAPGAAALGFMKTGATAMGKNEDLAGVAENFLGGADGMTDGIAALAMRIVYPDLKAVFEAGTRKITVRVSWFEGRKEYYTELEQWVVSSKDAGLGANLGGLIQTEEEEDEPTSPKTPKTPKKPD
ncbi:MAG: prepilin-type N-terminal cleavage/methylation domain-containing protein [Polyangiaceae bacterium]|nr:prepilin-type N-terminal cleavage/methylation domain-containing protein [Polyangiaceae bacterium]